jgi:hypothetical protein
VIYRTVLVVCTPFGAKLSAARTAAEIARGLRAGNPDFEIDLCPLEPLPRRGSASSRELHAQLLELDFDARMRRARAVVIAARRLDRETLLQRGAVFEIATRARQSGVPACALVRDKALDPFDARILDLQAVLQARDAGALATAASRVALLM